MKFKTALAVTSLLFCSLTGAVATEGEAVVVGLAKGDQLWSQNKLLEARSIFEQVVSSNPKSVGARMKLGGLLLSVGDYDVAIPTYQKAISLDGNNVRAWMGLGFAYLHTQQKELSRAAFAEAIRIDPSRKPQLAPLIARPEK